MSHSLAQLDLDMIGDLQRLFGRSCLTIVKCSEACLPWVQLEVERLRQIIAKCKDLRLRELAGDATVLDNSVVLYITGHHHDHQTILDNIEVQ